MFRLLLEIHVSYLKCLLGAASSCSVCFKLFNSRKTLKILLRKWNFVCLFHLVYYVILSFLLDIIFIYSEWRLFETWWIFPVIGISISTLFLWWWTISLLKYFKLFNLGLKCLISFWVSSDLIVKFFVKQI